MIGVHLEKLEKKILDLHLSAIQGSHQQSTFISHQSVIIFESPQTCNLENKFDITKNNNNQRIRSFPLIFVPLPFEAYKPLIYYILKQP